MPIFNSDPLLRAEPKNDKTIDVVLTKRRIDNKKSEIFENLAF